MKKIYLATYMLACATTAAASGPDVVKFLAQRGWTAYQGNPKLTMPSDGIAPLIYYAKGARVPSCGLLIYLFYFYFSCVFVVSQKNKKAKI